ncbi:MAG TPA: response regulator transcription factor [Acidimicrobiales bacterium]|nr:response regulator transcription factor [Acidimicrobiales bacterium]
MIRLLIVDDQALLRAGFRKLLEAEFDMAVVGEAADGEAAIITAASASPDVILMDIRMPKLDGIEATRRIVAAGGARVLMLTTYDLDEYVFAALRAGASGFLLKDTPPEQLLAGIRAVAAGDSLLGPSVTRRLIETFARQAQPDEQARGLLAQLTTREREVLVGLAAGLSNAEIGADLFLSESTVKSHVSSVLAKLGIRDRVQAVVFAYETGVVIPGSAPA